MSSKYPLSVQIGEVETEIAMRKQVYPQQIAAGHMKQKDADNKIAIMVEVSLTLRGLREQALRLHIVPPAEGLGMAQPN